MITYVCLLIIVSIAVFLLASIASFKPSKLSAIFQIRCFYNVCFYNKQNLVLLLAVTFLCWEGFTPNLDCLSIDCVYNPGDNIVTVSFQYQVWFTTSKTGHDIYYNRLCAEDATLVVQRLKTCNLWKLGNIKKISKLGGLSLPSKNDFSSIMAKN